MCVFAARSVKTSGIGRLLVTILEATELKAAKPNGEHGYSRVSPHFATCTAAWTPNEAKIKPYSVMMLCQPFLHQFTFSQRPLCVLKCSSFFFLSLLFPLPLLLCCSFIVFCSSPLLSLPLSSPCYYTLVPSPLSLLSPVFMSSTR